MLGVAAARAGEHTMTTSYSSPQPKESAFRQTRPPSNALLMANVHVWRFVGRAKSVTRGTWPAPTARRTTSPTQKRLSSVGVAR